MCRRAPPGLFAFIAVGAGGGEDIWGGGDWPVAFGEAGAEPVSDMFVNSVTIAAFQNANGLEAV